MPPGWPGEPADTPAPRPFLRRRSTMIVGGVAIAAAAVGGGVAVAAAFSDGTSTAGHALPADSASPSSGTSAGGTGQSGQGGKAGKQHGAKGTRGVVLTESGATWTIRTADGKTITVKITAQTHYGTKKAPAQAGAFHTGSTVVVIGPQANGTITAKRIATPMHGAKPHPSPTPSATS